MGNETEQNLSRIILLCGIPAAGKSTYAAKLAGGNENIAIECADTWRGKLSSTGDESDQSHNARIFLRILPDAVRKLLRKGKTVIIDVTAVAKKDRKSWVQLAKSNQVEIECHYFAPNVDSALERNKNRDRKVPEEVIKKFANKFEIPTVEEGFSEVKQIV